MSQIGAFIELPNGEDIPDWYYKEICKNLEKFGFLRFLDSKGITRHTVLWHLCINGRPINFKRREKRTSVWRVHMSKNGGDTHG